MHLLSLSFLIGVFALFTGTSAHAETTSYPAAIQTTQYTNTQMNQNWQGMNKGNTYGYWWGYNQASQPNIVQSRAPEVRSGEMMRNLQTGQTTGLNVQTQNVSAMDVSTPLCAEQFTNGVRYHLGCIPSVPYQSAANGPSLFDFNVWPAANVTGNSTIVFTYRDTNGNWREITSPTYQPERVSWSS